MHIASIGIDLGKTTFHLIALGERSEAGYIYADCPFAQLQTSCSPAAPYIHANYSSEANSTR